MLGDDLDPSLLALKDEDFNEADFTIFVNELVAIVDNSVCTGLGSGKLFFLSYF